MPIIFRYISSIFLSSFFLFFILLTILTVIVDFATKADEFLTSQVSGKGRFILEYYYYKLPFLTIFVLPASLLFASMFVTLKLSKNNELVPIMTSGMSMRKFALPFFLTAILIAIAIGVLDELILPKFSYKVAEFEEMLRKDMIAHGVIANDFNGNLISANKFDRKKKEMEDVSVIILEERSIKKAITAKKASWDSASKAWILFQGEIEEYEGGVRKLTKDEQGNLRFQPIKIPEEGYRLELGIHPREIAKKSFFFGQFMSLKDAITLSSRQPHIPLFKMQIYSKFTFPFIALVLLLLGFPYFTPGYTRNLFTGIAIAFSVILLFYMIQLQFMELGTKGIINPILANFLPLGFCALVGLRNFLLMKT